MEKTVDLITKMGDVYTGNLLKLYLHILNLDDGSTNPVLRFQL